MLTISTAAGLCGTDASVSGRFALIDVIPLTSQRMRRKGGPENFQSSVKKGFFNTIGATRTYEPSNGCGVEDIATVPRCSTVIPCRLAENSLFRELFSLIIWSREMLEKRLSQG
jgi:hypothetical protein